MKLKERPEDFIVEEIPDFEKIKEKNENKNYIYFWLTKRNYNQLRAIKQIARYFRISKRRIHFAGTKDKHAVTSQVISIRYDSLEEAKSIASKINNNAKDITLELIGKFKGRINLGDIKGNKFKIIVRELSKKEIENGKKRISKIKKYGVKNYFDTQRFGYAENTHLIGKLLLKNHIKEALYLIFTSLPKNPSEDLKEFVKNFPEEFYKEELKRILKKLPKSLKEFQPVIEHLIRYPNDYIGALRKIHKKLRTLYINAYQSYIFNKTLDKINEPIEIPIIGYETEIENFKYKDIIKEILEEEDINKEEFKLPYMPELATKGNYRKSIIIPEDLNIKYDNKAAEVTFKLPPGSYATIIIKNLFL